MQEEVVTFNDEEIRIIKVDNRWYYSILDVIYVLTESSDPKLYVKALKRRKEGLKEEWDKIVRILPLQTIKGKQGTICADASGILKIAKLTTSKQKEEFESWLKTIERK